MSDIDNKLLKLVLQSSSVCLVGTMAHTGEPIHSASNNVSSMLGYSAHELSENRVMFDDLIHEDDIAQYLLESQQGLLVDDCNEVTHSPYRLLHRDGYIIWVKDSVQIVRQNSHVDTIVHVITDVTNEML